MLNRSNQGAERPGLPEIGRWDDRSEGLACSQHLSVRPDTMSDMPTTARRTQGCDSKVLGLKSSVLLPILAVVTPQWTFGSAGTLGQTHS